MPDRDALLTYLEEAIAFTTQSLLGETPVELAAWPHAQRYELHRQALGTIHRFDQRRKRDATLRAREELALVGFGGPYGTLPTSTQGRINNHVQTVIRAYELHLQGLTEPVHESIAKELQPERRKVS